MTRGGRRIRILFWAVAILLGAVHAGNAALEHSMGPDGVAYLDLGDAYVSGDAGVGLNGYWSPLYPWLLGLMNAVAQPSPDWEFPAVHALGYLIFLGALAAFDFFWRRLVRARHSEVGAPGDTFPEWAWLAIGYALFLWSSVYLIRLSSVNPDMGVAALVYLAAGLLLRVRDDPRSRVAFPLLGAVLGLAYLAKAAMFPLAFVFLAMAFVAAGRGRRAARRSLVALAAFVAVSGPFVVALSLEKGRPTFGDTGRINYAWFVNGVPQFHWQGEPAFGQQPHPTRRALEPAALYEFGQRFDATYPPWYDPSHWYEGVEPRFELGSQLRVLVDGSRRYFEWLARHLGAAFSVLLFVYLSAGSPLRRLWGGMRSWAVLLVPAAAALGMYALVHVEGRYVASFIVLLAGGLLAGARLPEAGGPARFGAVTGALIALAILVDLGAFNVTKAANALGLTPAVLSHTRASLPQVGGAEATRGTPSADSPLAVAQALRLEGIGPGSRIVSVGFLPEDAYWARLARVRIVAEIPYGEAVEFRNDAAAWRRALRAVERVDASAIVATYLPAAAVGERWERLGETSRHLRRLPSNPEVP